MNIRDDPKAEGGIGRLPGFQFSDFTRYLLRTKSLAVCHRTGFPTGEVDFRFQAIYAAESEIQTTVEMI